MCNKKDDVKIVCVKCGMEFVFTVGEQRYFEQNNLCFPKRCKACRKIKKERKKQIENEKWQAQEKIKIKTVLEQLNYNNLTKSELTLLNPRETLYVIGNGFDIMHGVPSRYSDFRDSMGKNNNLRWQLETYLKSDSLWSDFEEALAHINGSAMLGTVDMWLDDFDAYDEDAQAADFFAAIDIATSPATEIAQTLPIRFRKWVETLKTTKEPVWLDVFRPESKYLNFNYTEFLETIYNIPSQAITYIHGCRKNKKQALILGHAPNANEFDDWTPALPIPNYKSQRKAYMIDSALDVASRALIDYDEATTKDTRTIIKRHCSFFSDLTDIKNIVVIGHSLSVVDYPYFKEIIDRNNNTANWFISWYSSRDLENIRALAYSANLRTSQINLII